MGGRVTQESPESPEVAEVIVTEGILDSKLMPKADVTPPFTGYEEINHKPYSADYFKLDFWNELTDELDVNNIKADVKSIEKFITEKIGNERLDDDIFTYQRTIGEIESKLNLKDIDPGDHRLKKVADYIDVLMKQKKLSSKMNKLVEKVNAMFGGK